MKDAHEYLDDPYLNDDILDKDMLNIMLAEMPPLEGSIPSEKMWNNIVRRVHHLSNQNPETKVTNDTYTITIRSNEGNWKAITPLIQMKVLRDNGQTRTFLLKLSPGAALPAHHHLIEEECLVLEGDVFIGNEKVSAGDYHLAKVGSRHGILGSQNGALLLLRGESR